MASHRDTSKPSIFNIAISARGKNLSNCVGISKASCIRPHCPIIDKGAQLRGQASPAAILCLQFYVSALFLRHHIISCHAHPRRVYTARIRDEFEPVVSPWALARLQREQPRHEAEPAKQRRRSAALRPAIIRRSGSKADEGRIFGGHRGRPDSPQLLATTRSN